MPDLVTEFYYHCSTAENWEFKVVGSGDREYIVKYSPAARNSAVAYDYSCSCPAYKYGKGKSCKHIQQAKIYHCNWMQFLSGGDPVEKNGEKCCPNCGKPVIIQGWGV